MPLLCGGRDSASRNEAIVPRDAGEKKGSGFLGRRVFDGATLPPSRDQANRCGNSLLVVFSSLVGAQGSASLWALPSSAGLQRPARMMLSGAGGSSRFDTGLAVCPFRQEPA